MYMSPAPQSVTPRTAELAQNKPHDEQVAVRLPPYGAGILL